MKWYDIRLVAFGLTFGLLLGLVAGWWLHGGLASYQYDEAYHFGEANGYNRGYEAGIAESTSAPTDNETHFLDFSYYQQQYDLWSPDKWR
ncbi:MAG: hypothetical protein JRN35_06090 [Nitrososphaerota archaeon]|nr:hypothetical protein [Nitrososphaerota archaeon]